MSKIFRPARAIFEGDLPLIAVFGAYRCADAPPLHPEDHKVITCGIDLARRIHAPLAFAQPPIQFESAVQDGWLPSCRPKVTDRVFECAGPSLLENREFSRFLRSGTSPRLVTIGPKDDSVMRATVSAVQDLIGQIEVVVADHPLQKCSTTPGFAPDMFRTSRFSAYHQEISFTHWARKTCPDEHSRRLT